MVKLKRVTEDLSGQEFDSSFVDQKEDATVVVDQGFDNKGEAGNDWMKYVPSWVKPLDRSKCAPLVMAKIPDMELSEFVSAWNKLYPSCDWRIDDVND